MLKDKYTLVQENCCVSPANFSLYETLALDADDNTAMSDANLFNHTSIGKF